MGPQISYKGPNLMAIKVAIPIYVEGSKHLRKRSETSECALGHQLLSFLNRSQLDPVSMTDAEHFCN